MLVSHLVQSVIGRWCRQVQPSLKQAPLSAVKLQFSLLFPALDQSGKLQRHENNNKQKGSVSLRNPQMSRFHFHPSRVIFRYEVNHYSLLFLFSLKYCSPSIVLLATQFYRALGVGRQRFRECFQMFIKTINQGTPVN